MAQLPGPPDEYSDAEREAWQAGAITALRLIGSHAHGLAGRLDDARDEDSDAADDRCPDCGGDLIEGFGGQHCTDCETTIDA